MSLASQSTRSGGTESIQTSKEKEILALWASACARALSCQRVCEKEKLWKERA